MFRFIAFLTLTFCFPIQAFPASQPPIYRWEVRGFSGDEPNNDRPWSTTFKTLATAEEDFKETNYDYHNKNGLQFASPDKPLGLYIMKYVVIDGVFKPAADSMAFGNLVDSDFRQEVFEIADRLKIRPDYLMTVMAIETSKNVNGKMVPTFDSSIKNPGSSAVGLIQFMASTAKDLGTTTENLARMSAVDQLSYVEKYLKPDVGQMKEVEDVYLAVFYPAAIGKKDDYEFRQRIYGPNKGLDKDKNGKLTKGEILGSMSLGGSIIPVENLAESLQVAHDAEAKRILLPMASVSDIPTIPGELFAKFQTGFYADPRDAAFKALGVE